MLGIAKVPRGREAYYLSTVPTGRRHDGGLVEPDGEWTGRGAGLLGLDGAVQPAVLRDVLAGVHPQTKEQLSPSHASGRVQLAGYDCTLSTPKSLSLLHALGPDEAVDAVRLAHGSGVAAALSYLEERGARSRRPAPSGRGDRRVSSPVEGLIAASFVHRASRAPDPHLHSHVLIVNCARGLDGRWSPLDGRALFAEAGTAAHLYEAQVRREVADRLGLRFGLLRGSSAELDGIDEQILRAFSRRTIEIEQRLAQRGLSGPRARRIAALATRKPKDLSVSYESLVSSWRERALDIGMPAGRLGRLVERGRAGPPSPGGGHGDEVARGLRAALGDGGLTATRASFTRSDLVRAGCRSAPAGATAGEVERAVDELLRSPAVVERGAGTRWFGTAGGRRIPVPVAEARFTTPEVEAIEASIAEMARSRRGAGVAICDRGPAERALQDRGLCGADRSLALGLLADGHGVEVVWAGAPRTGWGTAGLPSDALDAARAGWEAGGRPVLGVAPTAAGARRLEATTGIESVTLDALGRHPRALERSVAALRPGSVLAVGAAERVGPRALAGLLDGAAQAEVKVVLVAVTPLSGPDDGLLRAVAAAARPPERASSPGDSRDAVAAPAMAGTWFEIDRSRVAIAPSAGDARRLLAETWRAYAATGRAAVVVTEDPPSARALRAAGCGPVVPPRGVAKALAAAPDAALLVLGNAGALPAAVRRHPAIERVHVATDRAGDTAARLGRAAEIALAPGVVRAIGSVPRSREGRSAWRSAADAWLAQQVAPDVGLAPEARSGHRAGDDRLSEALGALRDLRAERSSTRSPRRSRER